MMKRKTMEKRAIVSFLIIFVLVSVSCASANFIHLEKLSQMQSAVDAQSNNEKVPNPYGFSFIEVYTQEKYGTKDDPQYRPLPNVSLVLWTCGWFISLPVDLIDFLRWRNDEGPPPSWFTGSTDENGYLVIPHVYLGNYRLFASKEGFVDISSKRHWGVLIWMCGAPNGATCTLTAEGGPWDSQSCQQSNPSPQNQQNSQQINSQSSQQPQNSPSSQQSNQLLQMVTKTTNR